MEDGTNPSRTLFPNGAGSGSDESDTAQAVSLKGLGHGGRVELSINKDYARRYHYNQRRAELQRCMAKPARPPWFH